MKKLFLLKMFSLAFCLLVHSLALGQNVANLNCPNPAGGCDTIGIEQKISPWRVGGFIGPAVAFCGKWSSTFNSDKYRDKSLFNGIGFHAGLNADYFFNVKKKKQLKFGVGAVAGLQMFFLRNDLDTFLDQIIAESGSNRAVIRKGSSEDHYLAVGPVLSYAFGKKPRSPFIEASVRGGLFRTTPAAIFVYDEATSNNIYSVTATDKRYHAGLLATLGLFFPSKKGLWSWGVEAAGFRTKVNYIFPGATIYSYQRKHGGFTAGLAFRRNFVRDVPVPKAPTPPLICEAPDLELMINGKSVKGMIFSTLDSSKADSINISWKSRTILDSTKSETFTARLHQLNGGMDNVIAQVVCQKETKMAWPAAYLNPVTGRPVEGQYYVTVQSQQISTCASCISEPSTTGFAVQSPDTVKVKVPSCFKQCFLEVYAYKKVKVKRVKYGKSPTSCVGCICPVDTVSKTISQYHLLGTVKRDDCDASKLDLNSEISNIKIPSWATTVYTSVETVVAGECEGLPQGKNKINYSAPVKKGKAGIFKRAYQKK
ncbi:hypothetical protein SAMN04487995_2258 [Dyadobacter koreensis]|uniref:Outer membrane protein beta-barrel domain-containing protein n=1 Tax=Dyadobacter koreensis TaxID=408657 RepID=A0A1H6TTV2_9BACT|nr:PorT family protein [Dyadobacter koreensis]SEI79635.1 hypothetical protein SAMN04487995_2258 [Dyadobacter koreensis]